MSDIKVWTCYGGTADEIASQVQDLIDRGGRVISLGIGYGPSPAKLAGLIHGTDAWHGVVVIDVSGIDPDA